MNKQDKIEKKYDNTHLYSKNCIFVTKKAGASPAIPVASGDKLGVVGYIGMGRGKRGAPPGSVSWGYVPRINSSRHVKVWMERAGYRTATKEDLNPPKAEPKPKPKPKPKAKKK